MGRWGSCGGIHSCGKVEGGDGRQSQEVCFKSAHYIHRLNVCVTPVRKLSLKLSITWSGGCDGPYKTIFGDISFCSPRPFKVWSKMAFTFTPVSSLNRIFWPHCCMLANHGVSSLDGTVSRNTVSTWLSLESFVTDLQKHYTLK